MGKRKEIAAQIESELRPLLNVDSWDGGYNCCGCSTYEQSLDDAIAIVRGTYLGPRRQRDDD